jgi:hypothetical protein
MNEQGLYLGKSLRTQFGRKATILNRFREQKRDLKGLKNAN